MFIRPCEGRISSRFSQLRKNPVTGIWKSHKGVDFGKDGSSIIKASASGTVTRASVMEGYGNAVTIAHVINGKKYETLYAHLRSISVKVGQDVKQGQQIGIKGETGNATGVHLHFEIHIPMYAAGQPNAVNPLHYIFDANVLELQRLLVKVGYKLAEDGIEGQLTETAIKEFQNSQGLPVDGLAGVVTLAALNRVVEMQKEESTMNEGKLNSAQEAIRQEAIRLKITDGKDPFKDVNQFYSWAVALPIAQKNEELERRIMVLESNLKKS